MKKRILAILLAVTTIISLTACSSGSSDTASDDNWPEDTLTVIVPWSSGGGADTSARLFAQYWGEALGTTIVIENREGGDGVVGASYYEGLTQDANTVLMMAQPFLSAMIIEESVDFTLDQFSMIGVYESDPSCLAVSEGSEYSTFEALDEAIQANPGTIKIGVNGSSYHLVMTQLLIEKYGWDVKLVYYSGASDLKTALMGGHVDVIATTMAGCTEEVPIVIGSTERNDAHPDCPTYYELTEEETIFSTTRMFLVDKSVEENYPERYQKLLDTFAATCENEEFLAAAEEAGRGTVTVSYDADASWEILEAQHVLATDYWNILSGEE